ncbi:MAG: V-type ATPase subunit [Clostridia bacterium]|nr:V-type ATPase subunit [Clostridia bacterium]
MKQGMTPLFANSSAAVLSDRLIGEEKLNRLMEASIDDALKLLAEQGYGDGLISTANDFGALIDAEKRKLCSFFKDYMTDEKAVASFLLPFDYLNAKVAMKCKYMKINLPELSDYGLINPKELSEKILADDYGELPAEMSKALGDIDLMFFEGDRTPLAVDVTLDKAMYANIRRVVERSKCAALADYYAREADCKNLLMLFRVAKADKSEDFYKRLLLDGGYVPTEELVKLFGLDADKKAAALAKYDCAAVAKHAAEDGNLIAAEKEARRYTQAAFYNSRHSAETIEPLAVFFLDKTTEIDNVRLILTCLKNNVGRAEIAARLNAYV